MVTIPQMISAISTAFILCIGLSYAYAAHPQAATDQSDDRGSQGNQDLTKGDSTPKKGQDEKVDEKKFKEDKNRPERNLIEEMRKAKKR